MNDSRTWTRPRFFLALLLAALVAGAVPIRVSALRGDKASGAGAWRAASARAVSSRPDGDLAGFAPLPAAVPELLPLPRILGWRAPAAAYAAAPAPAPARSPLPRAPPLA